MDDYKAEGAKREGMSYDELKKYEVHPDPIVSLYARLYNPESPPLRLNDWINSFIGKNGLANEIVLGKKLMNRRIKKTVKQPDIVRLHPNLIKFFKQREINGFVFKAMSGGELIAHINHHMPNAGVRHWRTKYVSDIVSKQTGEERVASAKYMDHSLATQVEVYQKD